MNDNPIKSSDQLLLDTIVEHGQRVIASMPQPQVTPNAKGMRFRFPPGKIFIAVDDKGPVPLKVRKANGMGFYAEPLNKQEIEDFILRMKASAIQKVASEGGADGRGEVGGDQEGASHIDGAQEGRSSSTAAGDVTPSSIERDEGEGATQGN